MLGIAWNNRVLVKPMDLDWSGKGIDLEEKPLVMASCSNPQDRFSRPYCISKPCDDAVCSVLRDLPLEWIHGNPTKPFYQNFVGNTIIDGIMRGNTKGDWNFDSFEETQKQWRGKNSPIPGQPNEHLGLMEKCKGSKLLKYVCINS